MDERRVKYDPRRTQGNANLIATGGVPPSCSVVSTSEIAHFEALISPHTEALKQRELRQSKADASKERMHGWTDTLEAKRKQYIADRTNRLESDERRRQLLDDEEAQFQATKRQQRLEDAQRQLMDRDERGMRMKSNVLLHEVIEERTWQISMKEAKRKEQEEDAQRYADEVRRGAQDEIAEKIASARREREKMTAVKQQQWDMLEKAVDARREAKKCSHLDAEALRRGAEEEARENKEKRDARRAAERLLQSEVALQMSPRLSPRQQLAAASQRVDPDAVSIEQFEARKREQAQSLEGLAKLKNDRHAATVARATALLADTLAQPAPKERTVDAFASVPSIAETLTAQSNERKRTMEQHKRDVTAAPSPRTMRGNVGLGESAIERNVEELKSPRYREKLDKQLDMLNRFEEEQRQRLKEEAKYLAMVQTLQAGEKKQARQLEREMELQEVVRRREGLAAEDEMFREFVEAHLPNGMSPRLAARARVGIPVSPRTAGQL